MFHARRVVFVVADRAKIRRSPTDTPINNLKAGFFFRLFLIFGRTSALVKQGLVLDKEAT